MDQAKGFMPWWLWENITQSIGWGQNGLSRILDGKGWGYVRLFPTPRSPCGTFSH